MNETTQVLACRGVRGATTADTNDPEEILLRTRQLLGLLIRRNHLKKEDICSAVFSMTSDLDSEFPALAARQLGWFDVPLMCVRELEITGSLPRCIRILLHWNTTKTADEIVHIYVRDAEHLRPDMGDLPPVNWEALETWLEEHLDDSVKSNLRK